MKVNGKKGEFIYGPQATFEKEKVHKKLQEFEEKGFFTLFHNIFLYSKHTLFKIELHDKQAFVESLIETATEVNSKEETKKWIQELLTNLSWR